MNNQPLIIRADASWQIGSGHVMRCLALAQAWRDQAGPVTFVAAIPDVLRTRLEAEGIAVRPVDGAAGSRDDAQQVIALSEKLRARHIVVDGYHFGPNYQAALKAAGLRVLVLDDNCDSAHYYADVVLNQNHHAYAGMFLNHEPYTILLLGTRYTLLRREFWAWRAWERSIPQTAQNVLVTLGGSDPTNNILKTLQALDQLDRTDWQESLIIKAVVGGQNPHLATLRNLAQHTRHTIQIEQNVQDMPGLMAWADIAISAGGSTCWELAFMGLPNLILITADNQLQIGQSLDEAGVALNLGPQAAVTQDVLQSAFLRLARSRATRHAFSARGRQLVDGLGCQRVLDTFMGGG